MRVDIIFNDTDDEKIWRCKIDVVPRVGDEVYIPQHIYKTNPNSYKRFVVYNVRINPHFCRKGEMIDEEFSGTATIYVERK